MDVNNLKYVVGKAETNQPAIIRFFGSVDSFSTDCFNEEFLWLQDYVKPSKIVVLINSDGGSVMYGMSTFSIIQSCPIEVDCIIEGIAASMGSVIWAAGDHLYMHDYSILMIHNPFVYDNDNEDANIKNMVNAFRKQIETIYVKRFGLSKDKVRAIMDGEGDADGTYLSAKEAVNAGILPATNIIKTSKQVVEKVKSQIEGVKSVASICDIMNSALKEVDENKLLSEVVSIRTQNNQNFNPVVTGQEQNTMKENENVQFNAVTAQLGLEAETSLQSVSARITQLINAESELKNVKNELGELKIKFKGKETEVANLQKNLSDVEGQLKAYKDAEEDARNASIDAMVEDAIKAGKIDAGSKEDWVGMAKANLDMVKKTLDSIPGRDNIVDEIAKDPENKNDAEEAMKDVNAKLAEKVKAVVGDITLQTF
jgi:ATP-dependent protease ClpP protease subunit|nr:MAG TPA_asm: Putative ATP dependent Clp protease [Caudoviricetes sp.]